jgi:hypothetical protein
MKILHTQVTGTQTSFSTNFGGKLSFIVSFLCPERIRCCYIYFHRSCTTTIISLEPCALNAEFQHFISYWDLIKFHYFADTAERKRDTGWKTALRTVLRQGDFRDYSIGPCWVLPSQGLLDWIQLLEALHLIRTGFLVKVFRMFRLEQIVLVFGV